MSLWRLVRNLVRDAARSDARPARPDAPAVDPERTRPDARAAAHVSGARRALLQGDDDACAEAAEEALARSPNDLFAAFYLGQARLRQGRLAEARAAFETARATGDAFGLVDAWLQRVAEQEREAAPPRPTRAMADALETARAARAAWRRGEVEQTRALAAEAVELDPGNLPAHHLLGRALHALGRSEEARTAFEAARPHEAGLGLVDQWLAGLERGFPAGEGDEEDEM